MNLSKAMHHAHCSLDRAFELQSPTSSNSLQGKMMEPLLKARKASFADLEENSYGEENKF